MIQGRDGHSYYELEDLALLWGPSFAIRAWDQIVTGSTTDQGFSTRTRRIIDIPTEVADRATIVRDVDWPDVLSAAMHLADKEGIS